MSPLWQLNGLSGRDLPGTGRSKPVILVPVTESDYFNWYVDAFVRLDFTSTRRHGSPKFKMRVGRIPVCRSSPFRGEGRRVRNSDERAHRWKVLPQSAPGFKTFDVFLGRRHGREERVGRLQGMTRSTPPRDRRIDQ